MRKILTIFERKFDFFCTKMWRFFQENSPTFTGKFNGVSRELGWFLHESLMVFTGIFDDYSGNSPRVLYYNNSHSNKTRQILLQKSSNFATKIVKFSCKNSQIFLKNLLKFSANAIKFFCNYILSSFSVKIINYSHKNC